MKNLPTPGIHSLFFATSLMWFKVMFRYFSNQVFQQLDEQVRARHEDEMHQLDVELMNSELDMSMIAKMKRMKRFLRRVGA